MKHNRPSMRYHSQLRQWVSTRPRVTHYTHTQTHTNTHTHTHTHTHTLSLSLFISIQMYYHSVSIVNVVCLIPSCLHHACDVHSTDRDLNPRSLLRSSAPC